MKLNIGAGAFSVPGWTNIDMPSPHYHPNPEDNAFIKYDITSLLPLPLASTSASMAYCSHVIEHVKDHDVFEFILRSP